MVCRKTEPEIMWPKTRQIKITNITSLTSHIESRTEGRESRPSTMMGEVGMQEGKQGVWGRAVEGRYGRNTLYLCMKMQQNFYLVHLYTQVIVIFGVPNWRDPKIELLWIPSSNCIYILKNVIVLLVCIFTVCRGTFKHLPTIIPPLILPPLFRFHATTSWTFIS